MWTEVTELDWTSQFNGESASSLILKTGKEKYWSDKFQTSKISEKNNQLRTG